MAYTFGAATSNLISWTANATSAFATNRTALVTCWVYPTTLTATRILWSAGTIWKLEIDTTTSSCRFTADATTDGVFTFPAGLALNTWTYIAVFVNTGATPAIQLDVWTATVDGIFTKQTVTTVTAPVGAFVTSNLVFGIGNTTTTPTLSFQGDMGGVSLFAENSGTNPGFMGVMGDGTTTAGEADSVLSKLVVPLWRGEVSRIVWAGSQAINAPPSGSAYSSLQLIAPLDDHLWTVKPASGQGVIQATLAGATVSARRIPRPFKMVNDNVFVNHRSERMTPSVLV